MQVPRLATVAPSNFLKKVTTSCLGQCRGHALFPAVSPVNTWEAKGPNVSASPGVTQLLVPLVISRAARRGIASVQSTSSRRASEFDPGPQLALTENSAFAFTTSGQACVDFLFRVVPGMSQSEVLRLLRAAWNEDPLAATKLVMQLGDPRKGKSNRDNHQLCLLWLWRNFPSTVLANIRSGALSHHTCLKGLLDLLMYAAWDGEDYVSKDLAANPDRGRARN